jgi:hypothetical protein
MLLTPNPLLVFGVLGTTMMVGVALQFRTAPEMDRLLRAEEI